MQQQEVTITTPQLLAGALCFAAGSIIAMANARAQEEEDEQWGFQPTGSGVVDGGNYDGWDE